MQTHSAIIDAFGGRRPLANEIDVDAKLTSHWFERGIPSKYWHKVVNAAAARGITITFEQLAASKPVGVQARIT